MFTEEPLPFELLQSSDADIKVQVQELVNEAIVRKDVLIEATLKEGDLIADIDFETHQKGKASASVKLLTENETATLRTALMARDLRLNLISGDVEDYTQIPPTSATIELASSGSSPRQLAANSSGEILLTQGSGRMDNQLLERFSGDILAQLATALNPAAKAEPYSRYECSIVVVSIKEGLASLDTTILQGEKVMIVAGGHIDLTTEKLNLEFNTKPRQGVGITADAFVTPFVALKGTLASPSIGLNEKGTLITAGAAAATGGLSLILQTALDRATAAINHCEETLPKHPHPPFKNV